MSAGLAGRHQRHGNHRIVTAWVGDDLRQARVPPIVVGIAPPVMRRDQAGVQVTRAVFTGSVAQISLRSSFPFP